MSCRRHLRQSASASNTMLGLQHLPVDSVIFLIVENKISNPVFDIRLIGNGLNVHAFFPLIETRRLP